MNLSAVILAGGKSKRMGCDKAWIQLDGKPLIAHAVEKARLAGVEEVFISGRAGQDYGALKCPILFDLATDFGPLGGGERALHRCVSPLLLVLAVDMPCLTARFLKEMFARCDRLTGSVPKLDGRLEPLVAVYPKRCVAIVCDFVARCRPAAAEFAEACIREHAVRKFRVGRADAVQLTNWNMPADIAATDISLLLKNTNHVLNS